MLDDLFLVALEGTSRGVCISIYFMFNNKKWVIQEATRKEVWHSDDAENASAFRVFRIGDQVFLLVFNETGYVEFVKFQSPASVTPSVIHRDSI